MGCENAKTNLHVVCPTTTNLSRKKRKHWQGEDSSWRGCHGLSGRRAGLQQRQRAPKRALREILSQQSKSLALECLTLLVQLHTCRRYADTRSQHREGQLHTCTWWFWAVPCSSTASPEQRHCRRLSCMWCHGIRLLECSLQAPELRHVVSSILCLLGFQNNPLSFASISFFHPNHRRSGGKRN